MSAIFRTAVARLAEPAATQELYLRQLGSAPSTDELALEFSDALAVERGELCDAVRNAASALDQYLLENSGVEELWTLEALYTSLVWERIRQLARDVLNRMVDDGAGGGSPQAGSQAGSQTPIL